MTTTKWIVLLSLLLTAACGRGAGNTKAPDIPSATQDASRAKTPHDPNIVRVDPGMLRDLRITTAAVESRSGREEVILLGELAVDERAYAEVGVPVPARVTRLVASAGDMVRAGQTLVELTSPELGKDRADYLSANARLKLAETALQRKRDLAAERIAPLREVQEAEQEAAGARAALRAAAAALGGFGVDPPTDDPDAGTSSTFLLRSPIAGAVIERSAVLGQMLDPSSPAFRIGNLSMLWLTVHAFERDAVRIERGVPTKIGFAALPGQDFDGYVAVVGRHVERQSRTIPVRIDVRNRTGALRPGMSATAAVPVGQSGNSILAVPVAAVQRVRNEWCVFLPKDPSTFEIRRIGRGRDLGAEVEVLSGLRAGDTIVVDGAFLLKAQAEQGEADHDAH
jgi:cobalt-zinc-cadmium efflux system membrane fusion protein